jgi:hypothetical protein
VAVLYMARFTFTNSNAATASIRSPVQTRPRLS